nr:GNAT family N-acetyltransferase [Clostridium perfringens]
MINLINHNGTKCISTERITLRPFCYDDAENMFKNWVNDPEVTKYLSWTPHGNLNVTKECLDTWIKAYESDENYHWAITLKENPNEVIGSIGAVFIDNYLEQAHIGYCLSKKYWNKGIVSKSLKEVLSYLFQCGFTRIVAIHHVLNPASGQVMQKCGMKFEGILRKARKDNKGEFFDIAQYALLKTDLE